MKEKLKKLNFKAIIKAFALLWGLALIVVMTITNVGIKEDFDLLQWISNSLILLGIMVFGLLMGESIGDDRQREKVGGLYQNSLKAYNDFRNAIEEIIMYFIQFFQWFMPKELEDKKVNYLVMNNMRMEKAKQIVKYCTLADLYDLKSHPVEKIDDNGNKFIIRQLEEFEIEPVEEVLRGEIRLNASNPNYYLSAFGKSNSKSILEVGKQLDKDIKFNKNSNRALKISFSLVISLIIGILTVNDFMRGDDTQAWVNLISRVCSLFTSLFSGWMSSVIDIKLKAEVLANKTNVLKLFKNALDKKMFIPKTENELAQEEYEKYLKEKEETIANVVDPQQIPLLTKEENENGRDE